MTGLECPHRRHVLLSVVVHILVVRARDDVRPRNRETLVRPELQ
jgi:hypothetical protein